MKRLTKKLYPTPRLPEKVLQFGEGAFLRAFADYAFDILIEKELFDGSITIVQPLEEGTVPYLAEQDGLYTLIIKGMNGGADVDERGVISCVQEYINPYRDYDNYMKSAMNPHLRYIISNTTEAGIEFNPRDILTDKPQRSFPGKVAAFLYKRFLYFNGDNSKGLVFLPCELIDNNGMKLRSLVQMYADKWELGPYFKKWLHEANVFCDTLVDRITTGFPHQDAQDLFEELGYKDELIDVSEPFYFWAIEGPAWLADELKFYEAGLNVIITDDISQYKTRKVRLLNGAHTCSVPAALLCGLATVGEMMADEDFERYLQKVLFEEIIPALHYLPTDELNNFAAAVLDRFSNPYVRHELSSIMLNSVSKFEVRVMPTIGDYYCRFYKIPKILTFSLAALKTYYKKEHNTGDLEVLDKLINKHTCEAAPGHFLASKEFHRAVSAYMDKIEQVGIREVMRKLIYDE